MTGICFNILEMMHDFKCMSLLLHDSHLLAGFYRVCLVGAAADAVSLEMQRSSASPSCSSVVKGWGLRSKRRCVSGM